MAMSIIGKKAPDFFCEAIVNNHIKQIKLADFEGKYKILFFYPLDFTFVCPTEIHAFQEALPEFEKRNAVVLGISVDSVYSHQAWLAQSKDKGGIQGVSFPLLSDITKHIAHEYDVLNTETGIAYRATFIIDKANIIQSVQVNNLGLGRNVLEVIRTLDAVQFVEKHGQQACPANWQMGEPGLSKTQQDVSRYLSRKK